MDQQAVHGFPVDPLNINSYVYGSFGVEGDNDLFDTRLNTQVATCSSDFDNQVQTPWAFNTEIRDLSEVQSDSNRYLSTLLLNIIQSALAK